MYGKVKIGDKEIEMISNGATPYRFKQVFKRDLLKFFSDAVAGKVEDGEAADVASKLGYVMAMQCEKADLSKLSEDTFIEWMEGFEANDVVLAAEDIIGLYSGNMEQTSDSKKEEGPQIES